MSNQSTVATPSALSLSSNVGSTPEQTASEFETMSIANQKSNIRPSHSDQAPLAIFSGSGTLTAKNGTSEGGLSKNDAQSLKNAGSVDLQHTAPAPDPFDVSQQLTDKIALTCSHLQRVLRSGVRLVIPTLIVF